MFVCLESVLRRSETLELVRPEQNFLSGLPSPG